MKYVYFDPTSSVVLQLLDTDSFDYAELPPASCLLTVTDSQFATASSGTWYVVNGVLTQTGPAPSAALLLIQAQAVQIAKISADCAVALTAGFSSSALGTAHTYPSQDTDQRNLQNAVSVSIGAASGWTTPVWCESGETWSLASHTAAQVQQVNADWLAFRVALQQKYAGLVSQITSAKTISDAKAAAW